ncbi:hypothetical protein D3C78_1784610 [compost metagenome]
MIEKQRDHQRKLPVALFKMTLHGGDAIAHQAKGHVPVRRTLMLNQRVHIACASGGANGIEDVGIAEPQILFDKTA